MPLELFIPGPVTVRPEILKEMSKPMIGHRTKEISALQESITQKVQRLLKTENTVILSTSSGTGLLEGSIRSFTKKKAAVFSVGAFGNRWYELAVSNGKNADLFQWEAGEAVSLEKVKEVVETGEYDVVTVTHNETSTGVINPVKEIGEFLKENYPDIVFMIDAVSSCAGVNIETDKWGIDVLVTSAQKCMGLPPGMSFASVSKKAYQRGKEVVERGYYFDMVALYDKVMKNYQYPSTPSISHMFALEKQLTYILDEEGLEERFLRHKSLAKIVQTWAQKHFDLLPKIENASPTVSCIVNTKGIDIGELNRQLMTKGFMLSNGYGNLKEKTFRIAHMGDMKEKTVVKLLELIEEIVNL